MQGTKKQIFPVRKKAFKRFKSKEDKYLSSPIDFKFFKL